MIGIEYSNRILYYEVTDGGIMTSPPVCSKCKNVALRFNDDGTGSCNVCSRTVVWNRPEAPEPPICKRCKTHSLSFMPEGYGWCQNCFEKFIWRPGADIDVENLTIPKMSLSGKQTSASSGQHDIKNAISFNKELTLSGDLIKGSVIDFEGDAITLSIKLDNTSGQNLNEVTITPIYDPEMIEIDEKEVMFSLLRKEETHDLIFRLWPKCEAVGIALQAKIEFYNPERDEYYVKYTEKHNIDIKIPHIHSAQLPEKLFPKLSRKLLSIEKEYSKIKIGGKPLFEVMKDMLTGLDLYLFAPDIQYSNDLFIGHQKAYGEDDDNQSYLCFFEVMGGPTQSKLLMKLSGPNRGGLMGLSVWMKNAIEKRINFDQWGGSGTIIQQHFHGDYIQNGASKVSINDSVVQRSNIGADIKVNADLDKLGEKIGEKLESEVQSSVHQEVKWLDKRNQARAKVLRRGQLELKGITEEMSEKMERHFNELLKDLPYPSGMDKKKLVIIMKYACYQCGSPTGIIQDRKWTKWLNFAIGGIMVGVGVGTLHTEIGVKGVKKLYADFTQTPLNKIPAKEFILTNEERDRMVSRLRDNGIFNKMHYCSSCNSWVCDKCFDFNDMLCKKCA